MARLTKRTPSGWALAAPCAPGVPLAMLARYENIGSAHQFRHLSELNTPKSPYPDGDTSILECPCCGSGEWLHNADESAANIIIDRLKRSFYLQFPSTGRTLSCAISAISVEKTKPEQR